MFTSLSSLLRKPRRLAEQEQDGDKPRNYDDIAIPILNQYYTVHLERRAERELRRLPQDVVRRIDAMFRRLANNLRPNGVVKLSGRTGSGWRIRVGEYRILYRMDDDSRRVEVYRIKYRREAYRR